MISVTILTKNSAKYLQEVLSALVQFDEVLIYDNGSRDETLEIAKSFPNVTIYKGDFFGFGPTHNIASNLARHDWILSIDSDEVVSKEMALEIFSLKLHQNSVFSFPRQNFYNEKWIRWCGWYPDRRVRLYNRKATKFNDAQVHEAVIVKGLNVIDLSGHLKHYSYDSQSDFLSKMQSYSDLFAYEHAGKRTASPSKAILHSMAAFFKSYIIKRGFMGGYEGFIISVYNGNTAFYKYLKLYERNKKNKYG